MNLEIFRKNGKQIRGGLIDGEPWFVAKDVCDALEIKNARDAIGRLKDKSKGVVSTDTLETSGGIQELTVVNEQGLYLLIMQSRKPSAVEFQLWVTGEVLPAIRKHGGYLTPEKVEEALLNPDTLISLATELKTERAARAEAERLAEERRPKALFADSVAQSSGSILVGQFAKLISTDGFKIGQNRMFRWLRENGYLHASGARRNQPKQRYIENGWFEIVERTVNNPDGSTRITLTTKITGKGQVALAERVLADFCGRAS